MRFCKWLCLIPLCFSHIGLANTVDSGVTAEEAIAKAKLNGWFEGLDLSGEQKATSKDVETFLNNAQTQVNAITNDALELTDKETKPSSPIMMFVSLSMPNAAFKNALKNAAATNTTVYINGMFEGDKKILDTMMRLEVIARDMTIKPNVKFGPTWFKQYNIQRVPALVFDDNRIQVQMNGFSELDFFKEKLKTTTKSTDFGDYGATYPVEEGSLIEQIRKLMADINWDSKKKSAVDRFWKKRSNTLLDTTLEDHTFYIDPTVKVQKDIVNKAGVVLAREGTTVNPLLATSAYLGLYIINPLDPRQIKWLDAHQDKFDYRDQIIVTQIDVSRGWEHLSELRQRYKREIFLLEKELVTKFALKAVPSTVTVEKGFLRIDEKGMRTEQ
ncbi:TrbC family F-type conjugative pilus assembly protein (plasmid) [Shewanella sp. HL-SH4]